MFNLKKFLKRSISVPSQNQLVYELADECVGAMLENKEIPMKKIIIHDKESGLINLYFMASFFPELAFGIEIEGPAFSSIVSREFYENNRYLFEEPFKSDFFDLGKVYLIVVNLRIIKDILIKRKKRMDWDNEKFREHIFERFVHIISHEMMHILDSRGWKKREKEYSDIDEESYYKNSSEVNAYISSDVEEIINELIDAGIKKENAIDKGLKRLIEEVEKKKSMKIFWNDEEIRKKLLSYFYKRLNERYDELEDEPIGAYEDRNWYDHSF